MSQGDQPGRPDAGGQEQPPPSQPPTGPQHPGWEFPPWGDPRWAEPQWQQWWYDGGWRYDPRWADPQWQQWWYARGGRAASPQPAPYAQPAAYAQQPASPGQPVPPAGAQPPGSGGAAPGPVTTPPPTGARRDPVPAEPLGYHLVLRGGRRGWWWTLLGLVAVPGVTFVVAPFVLTLFFLVGFAVTGQDPGEGLSGLVDLSDPSPLSLAFLNLTLAVGIPAAMLGTWLIHGLRPGWLSSVVPRLRWRWMALCTGLALVSLVATVLVGAVLPAGGAGPELSSEPNAFTDEIRNFALVVLVLTPLQAAGEEYVFRGYLTQAFGSLFAGRLSNLLCRVIAVTLPAVLFALAHGAQDAPVFVDRLAFGLVSGVLVLVTGGLEAGIAMHVLNNFLAFGVALAFSDMESALSPSGGSWWSLPSTLTQSLVYLGLCLVAARALGIRTLTDPARMARSRQAPVASPAAPQSPAATSVQ